MGLKEQILCLDRRLRQIDSTPDCSGDQTILATAEPKRLAAFGEYLAEKIYQRFYSERLSATLLGCARVLYGPDAQPLRVVKAIVGSECFEQTIGEDVTGAAIFGWFCRHLERWPQWLIDVAAYEYIVHVAFLVRDRELEINEELEQQLCGPMQRYQVCEQQLRPGEIALAVPFIFKDFDYPARELQEVLEVRGFFEVEVVPEPYAAIWLNTESGLIEVEAIDPHVDILQYCERPKTLSELEGLFGAEPCRQAIDDLTSVGALKHG